jgi:hypothetical protein
MTHFSVFKKRAAFATFKKLKRLFAVVRAIGLDLIDVSLGQALASGAHSRRILFVQVLHLLQIRKDTPRVSFLIGPSVHNGLKLIL